MLLRCESLEPPMSQLGQPLPSQDFCGTAALPLKPDIARRGWHGRKVPQAEIARGRYRSSLVTKRAGLVRSPSAPLRDDDSAMTTWQATSKCDGNQRRPLCPAALCDYAPALRYSLGKSGVQTVDLITGLRRGRRAGSHPRCGSIPLRTICERRRRVGSAA